VTSLADTASLRHVDVPGFPLDGIPIVRTR
jgi:hypothetical protein